MSTAFLTLNKYWSHIPTRLICLGLLILTHTDAYQNIWDDTEFMAFKHCSHLGWVENRHTIFFGNNTKISGMSTEFMAYKHCSHLGLVEPLKYCVILLKSKKKGGLVYALLILPNTECTTIYGPLKFAKFQNFANICLPLSH